MTARHATVAADLVPEPHLAPRESARDAYYRTLIELACDDLRIWCLDSDTGPLHQQFLRACPARYVDIGIAEATMMTVAAGLASTGKVPFVNTMAGFACARAYEQVKIDIAYNALPVKIVGTHGGLAGGHLGPTHHALEDLAIMRVLPHMTVLVPADAAETVSAVRAAAALAGPVYVRLGRAATPAVYDQPPPFSIGLAVMLRAGGDVTLVACGPYPVLAALEAHDALASIGISARVLNMPTLKPLDDEALIAAARETAGIVTIEEHSVIGGLGGATAELLSERMPCRIRRIGVADSFCREVGPQRTLLDHHGICARTVIADALSIVRPRRELTRTTA